MFGSLGAPELIAIFVLALLLFGPKKLPELGRALGRSFAEFRRATTDLKSTFERELAEADRRMMNDDVATALEFPGCLVPIGEDFQLLCETPPALPGRT